MFVIRFRVYQLSDRRVQCKSYSFTIIKYISSLHFTISKDNLTFIQEVC